MARKKKAKRFRAVTAVKELARERVGAPPAGQIVVEKKEEAGEAQTYVGEDAGRDGVRAAVEPGYGGCSAAVQIEIRGWRSTALETEIPPPR